MTVDPSEPAVHARIEMATAFRDGSENARFKGYMSQCLEQANVWSRELDSDAL
jgi:hypothetical protein